ncbi:hypothetical protein Dsin_002567 [Dipteronia sinensis]|uniref:Uncharacterized protein n=1 Tax=Dipteronia sinensis TaxID=43782 RepID=A0AAE0B6F6_9ROSI|nr:hypothetical protein Dsin_002567 [Dipteronia sinensis]
MEVLIKHVNAQHVVLESGIRAWMSKRNNSLHEAALTHDVNVVRILVKENPDFSYPANKCGETLLYIAAETDIAQVMVESLRTCSSATHEGPNGKTALYAEVRRNYPGGILLLYKLSSFNDSCLELQQEILALSEDINIGSHTFGVIHILSKEYEGYLSQIKGTKESHLVASALMATNI